MSKVRKNPRSDKMSKQRFFPFPYINALFSSQKKSLLKYFHSPVPHASLHLTGLIPAVCALQNLVGTAPESLRMSRIYQFPANQYHTGGEEQTPTIKVWNKQHRRKHHEMSPVVNTAVYAALILHNTCLERTKYQNAYIIT